MEFRCFLHLRAKYSINNLKPEAMKTPNMNEIIFENRNKNYGAYAIRRSYDDNVIKGLLTSMMLFASFIVVAHIASKLVPVVIPKIDTPTEILETFVYEMQLQEEVKPEVPKEKATPPPSKPNLNLPPVITNEEPKDEPKDEPKKVEDPTAVPGGTGTDPVATNTTAVDPGLGGLAGKNDKPVTIPAFNPEFNGDLMRYLTSNIVYPMIAVEYDVEGTVYLSFVIDEEGEITDVKVLRGIGYGCDKEAVDVVKRMPTWKPGRDEHNNPIKVLYTLPVKFKLHRG